MEAENIVFSGKWSIFGPFTDDATLPEEELAAINTIPSQLSIAAQTVSAREVSPDDQGTIKLKQLLVPDAQKPPAGATAYLMAEFECPEDGEYYFGSGADWWMAWYIDGQSVYDTLQSGNRMGEFSVLDHGFKVDLSKGKHLAIVLVKAGSGGWTFSASFDQCLKEKLIERIKINAELAYAELHVAEDALKNSHMKLAIFGSSVAFGAGATDAFGWGNRLKKLLEEKNWTVVNKSVGGDNTVKLLARIERDLLPEKPDMVIIALSLANEGLVSDPPLIFDQYVRNMRKLIQLCRKNNIIPIISNCYPNNGYNATHYNYIRKFNELLNSWQVASIDFLGAVDNGQGHWHDQCWLDDGHPNDLGHEEMYYSVPPSLFDNLADQYYAIPASDASWLHYDNSTQAGLTCSVDYPLHSFSLAFKVQLKSDDIGKAVAAVDDTVIGIDYCGNWSVSLADGEKISSEVKATPNETCHLALTHSYVNKTVSLYVNGKCAGSATSQLSADIIYLTGSKIYSGPAALYKDFLLYRCCLDPEAVQALAAGTVLRSSLELYAPLTDKILGKGLKLMNWAATGAALLQHDDKVTNFLA